MQEFRKTKKPRSASKEAKLDEQEIRRKLREEMAFKKEAAKLAAHRPQTGLPKAQQHRPDWLEQPEARYKELLKELKVKQNREWMQYQQAEDQREAARRKDLEAIADPHEKKRFAAICNKERDDFQKQMQQLDKEHQEVYQRYRRELGVPESAA
jgi:hypothetical protein